MTQEQTNNIKLITNSLTKFGITNPNIQAGILATISKESEFVPQSENLNYSAANIKRVWANTPDADIPKITNNPEALGNYKYGLKGGNASNEGYKYRGRGFNQITFKDTYKKFGDIIGVDLVSNPDLLNTPQVAADAAAAFFAGELKAGIKANSFKKFGVTDLNLVKDTTTATKIAIQINAGRRTNFNNPVVQEGYNKAIGVVDSLLAMLDTQATNLTAIAKFTKKNWIPITITVVGLTGLLTVILMLSEKRIA